MVGLQRYRAFFFMFLLTIVCHLAVCILSRLKGEGSVFRGGTIFSIHRGDRFNIHFGDIGGQL